MRITTQQIRQIISEELSRVLHEEDNSNPLEEEITKLVTDAYVKQYDKNITQQIFTLINTKLPDIDEPKAISHFQSDLAKEDPKGALQILRMIHYDFTPDEEEMVENIELYPLDKDNNRKKKFLINKKIQDKEFSGLFLRDVDFGDMDLSNAKMKGTALRGCNLSSVTGLESANLTGSSCGPDTEWPDGFDPVQAGVKVLSVRLARGMCEDITYSEDSKYKQISNNYWNSGRKANNFSEKEKLQKAYLMNVSDEELAILMCRSDRFSFYSVNLELLRRGFHEKEINCAKFDDC
jgi:hypothetical protein